MAVDDPTLFRMAQKLRRHSLESTTAAGSGHPSTCLSCADILSVLFFDEMHWDPRDPSGHLADVFVLSKGHAAPILWAVLKEAGAIDHDLLTLREFTSPLEGHPTPLIPWVRVATGSLGQGSRRRRAWPGPGRWTRSRGAYSSSWATVKRRKAPCGRPRSSRPSTGSTTCAP
jgi:transketolase N-terminal domain/subunit